MRTVVSIATLALATTMFAAPAFAQNLPAGGAPAAGAAAATPAAPAAAEGDDDGKKIGVGGDLAFTLPVGDLADGTGPLIGATVRVGYYVMPAFEAYLRAGYQFGLKKETETATPAGTFKVSSGINNIPIYVGGRYFFMQPYSGLYGNLEVGANMLSPSTEANGVSVSGDTQTRIGANIGAGYVISKDLPINIGAQLALLNLLGKEESSTTVGGATVKVEEKTQIGINIMVGYEARF